MQFTRRVFAFTICFGIFVVAGFCFASVAGAASVTTDATDYPPGDTVVITGSGFWPNETVSVQVTHVNGDPTSGEGHEPWLVVAEVPGEVETFGSFETFWVIPKDDNLDEELLVTAIGLSSGLGATTTFTDCNSILTITTNFPPVCLDTIDPGDAVGVCAELMQPCPGGSQAPLAGRWVLFFVNEGNCGVNVAQVPVDSGLTDANGEACVFIDRLDTLLVPSGVRSLRVKYLGEAKPGKFDPPNSACDPTEKTNISASNDCLEFDVVESCPQPCVVEITCPADVTVSCEESTNPASTGTATYTSSGTCPTLTLTYSDSETPGACPQEKTITRTWRVLDPDSNIMDECAQTITVVDDTPPILAGCPTDVTVECDAIPTAATVTAADNCDPSPVVTFSETETPGACAQEKTIARKWIATDACGNADSCMQVITVEDNMAPQITSSPGPVTVECLTDVPTPNTALVTATDNCDPSPVVTHVGDVSDNQTCPETITRTYKAADACGNFVTCIQIITVDDNTPPTLVGCPTDVTVECDAVPAAATVTATDNCDPGP
ncbi:MAG: hypothetical protein OEW00_08360, partial [candidate division Zixibacteria bacterium]|nr:hypothetical protein [candidate division Zixibacteria bacterium]